VRLGRVSTRFPFSMLREQWIFRGDCRRMTRLRDVDCFGAAGKYGEGKKEIVPAVRPRLLRAPQLPVLPLRQLLSRKGWRGEIQSNTERAGESDVGTRKRRGTSKNKAARLKGEAAATKATTKITAKAKTRRPPERWPLQGQRRASLRDAGTVRHGGCPYAEKAKARCRARRPRRYI
jgi:hypothetical protein